MSELNAKAILGEELKKAGLDISEELAVVAVKGVMNALPKVLMATENKLDDLLIPILAVLEPKIMELLDKIDGEDDPGR